MCGYITPGLAVAMARRKCYIADSRVDPERLRYLNRLIGTKRAYLYNDRVPAVPTGLCRSF